MWNTSRGLRETVIRAMAKVSLVWALAVLGALFMAASAQGQHDAGYPLSAAGAGTHSTAFFVSPGDAPHTAGLALALVVLGAGVAVLAYGATRRERGDREVQHRYAAAPVPGSDLPLALGTVQA